LKYNCARAFTLIELMIVVVIIGVLSLVAIPSYQKYVINSKMAESYGIIDVISKGQIAFFSQNQEFLSISSPIPEYISQPMVVQSDAEWERFGYPAAVGSSLFFSYKTWAGKIDGSGTEVAAGVVSGNNFSTLAEDGPSRGHYSSMGPTCNAGLISAEILGATAQPNFDWAILYAVGDLNNDQGSLCTAIAKRISKSGTDKDTVSSGFVSMNVGQ